MVYSCRRSTLDHVI